MKQQNMFDDTLFKQAIPVPVSAMLPEILRKKLVADRLSAAGFGGEGGGLSITWLEGW